MRNKVTRNEKEREKHASALFMRNEINTCGCTCVLVFDWSVMVSALAVMSDSFWSSMLGWKDSVLGSDIVSWFLASEGEGGHRNTGDVRRA